MLKRKRVLLLACSTILLCCSVIAGATFALFTDSAKVSNHLRAGYLDVTLQRTGYTHKKLDRTTGYLTTVTDTTVTDFSKPTNQNLFGLTTDGESADLMVPGVSYQSEMKLTNNGTVAFRYTVNVQYGGEGSAEFAKQLKVSLLVPDGTDGTWKTAASAYLNTLSQGFNAEDNEDLNGVLTVEAGQEKVFAVKVEFVDDVADTTLENDSVNRDPNEVATAYEVSFDLIIEATQQT